jgi:hypothetical protein
MTTEQLDCQEQLFAVLVARDLKPEVFFGLKILSGSSTVARDKVGDRAPASLRRLAAILKPFGLTTDDVRRAAQDLADEGRVTLDVSPSLDVDIYLPRNPSIPRVVTPDLLKALVDGRPGSVTPDEVIEHLVSRGHVVPTDRSDSAVAGE